MKQKMWAKRKKKLNEIEKTKFIKDKQLLWIIWYIIKRLDNEIRNY